MLKLDLACGVRKCAPDFIGVDQTPHKGVDVICDLNKYPWPFKDNSVDEINCTYYLEHSEDVISFMEELYRIMKIGAIGKILVPYWSHKDTWTDPTHKRGFNVETLFYFDKQWREAGDKALYKISADFSIGYTLCYNTQIIDEINNMGIDEKLKNFLINHCNDIYCSIQYNITKR